MKIILIMLAAILSGIQIGRIVKYYTTAPVWVPALCAGASTFLLCMGLWLL